MCQSSNTHPPQNASVHFRTPIPTLLQNFQVRVKFVTKIPSIRVTETPVAVPETLQRYGLSEVVNHLLGRDPPTPFDMLVMGRFLRSSLQSVMRRHALSGEAVLEVEYLPAMRQPTEAEHAEQVSNIPGADLLFLYNPYRVYL